MSDIGIQYYRALEAKGTGPDGKPLSAAELRVLWRLCLRHHRTVWCSFEHLETMAEAVHLSEGGTRRVIATLEARGLVQRYLTRSVRSGAGAANEYELPDLLTWMVQRGEVASERVAEGLERKRSAAVRGKFFEEMRMDRRERVPEAVQRRGGRVAAQGVRSMSAGSARAFGQGVLPMSAGVAAATGQGRESISAEAADVMRMDWATARYAPLARVPDVPDVGATVVEMHPKMFAPPAQNVCGGQTECLPSKAESESREEKGIPPLSPPGGSANRGNREKLPDRSVGLASGGGQSLMLVAARQSWEAERALLDGVDAAIFDEAMHVLSRCGVAAANTTRRLRETVREALASYCSERECPPADAGTFAVQQWQTYVGATIYLLQAGKPDLRRFFGQGFWLDVRRWPWVMSQVRFAPMERDPALGDVHLVLPGGYRVASRLIM